MIETSRGYAMKSSSQPSKPLVTENDHTRFMRHVEILPYNHPVLKTPCWLWVGAKSRGRGNRKWYGTFHVNRQRVRAHRFAHDVLGGGTCPAGWHRDHRCGVSLCVNPHHIEAVPKEVNELRKNLGRGRRTGLKVLPSLVTEKTQLSLPLYKPEATCKTCGGVNGHFDFCTHE